MNHLPNGTTGKALAIALGVLVLVALDAAAISPLLAFYGDTAQRLEDRRAVAQRYVTAARDLPALRGEVQQWREKTGEGGLLLIGANDAIAAANLQSTLKDLIEESGTRLSSAQTLPVETEANFRRVGLRVSFSGDLTALTTVLLGIQAAHPILSVGNLDLHGGEDAALTVVMDVYGFRPR